MLLAEAVALMPTTKVNSRIPKRAAQMAAFSLMVVLAKPRYTAFTCLPPCRMIRSKSSIIRL
jgi:hypothetical protein